MGEKSGEERKPEPNLELPSIFGRRKKRRGTEPEAAERSPVNQAQGVVTEDPSSPPAEQTPAEAQGAHTDATAEVLTAPIPETDGVASPVEPARSHEDARRTDAADTADTAPGGTAVTENVTAPAPTGRAADRRAVRPGGPPLPGSVAAVLTGLVVGLFGAGATYGGTVGCEAWRGTSSCGGGPGLLLLVAILALMVLLGAGLLALLRVPEPRSTSFLGVGLTFVVVLTALMSAVFSVWMFFAAPVLSAVAYGVAHWVTTRHVELPEAGPEHDVR